MYAVKCGADSKNKVKKIRESYFTKIEFEENKNCLDGERYQEECVHYV